MTSLTFSGPTSLLIYCSLLLPHRERKNGSRKWSYSCFIRHSLALCWMSPLCICAQSCLTLWDSMDCSLPGLSVHGISQARILEWVAISSSRGSSQPRDQICVSCVSGTERWILYQGTIRLVFKADIFPSALLGALESLLGFSGSVFVDAPLLAGSQPLLWASTHTLLGSHCTFRGILKQPQNGRPLILGALYCKNIWCPADVGAWSNFPGFKAAPCIDSITPNTASLLTGIFSGAEVSPQLIMTPNLCTTPARLSKWPC